MLDETFNNCVLGYAIAHATNLGLIEKINEKSEITFSELIDGTECTESAVKEICRNLEKFEIVTTANNHVSKAENFNEVFEKAGYFEWLLLGYGPFLSSPEASGSFQTFEKINGKFIASGSARIGKEHVDPILTPYIYEQIGSSLIDLGCGSAQRLISIAKSKPNLRCIGVEINADAVALARRNIQNSGLQDRISIVQADVQNLNPSDWRDVQQEVVMMSFMGHDMWPEVNAKATFKNLRACFGNCRNFILSDTVSDRDAEDQIFTNGFRFSHALMGKYIPTIDEWKRMLTQVGWEVSDTIKLNVQNTYIFSLTVKS